MLEYLIGYFALEFIHQSSVKNQAIAYVNGIPGRKLNIGATGVGQFSSPATLGIEETKCDICSDYTKNISFCELGQRLPYYDDQFSVVLASHILEHVDAHKVRCALKEMARVGEKVVIVLPNPWHHGFYIASGHKSKIYKLIPNGLHIKSIDGDGQYEDRLYLDTERFKIFQ